MSFQTHKTFVHLRETNSDIFYEIRELSVPEIVKIVHVTSDIFVHNPGACTMKPDLLASFHQSWVLGTKKVAWLLAAFIAIVTYTPQLTCSYVMHMTGYVLSKRSQTEAKWRMSDTKKVTPPSCSIKGH